MCMVIYIYIYAHMYIYIYIYYIHTYICILHEYMDPKGLLLTESRPRFAATALSNFLLLFEFRV